MPVVTQYTIYQCISREKSKFLFTMTAPTCVALTILSRELGSVRPARIPDQLLRIRLQPRHEREVLGLQPQCDPVGTAGRNGKFVTRDVQKPL